MVPRGFFVIVIGIIDYGAGNIRSVHLALERCGSDSLLLTDPISAQQCSALILPGVGSFRYAMQSLSASGWAEELVQQVNSGKPLLGICLGMQLLFESGSEDGVSGGLGLIDGSVDPFPGTYQLRVPHMGWNSVHWLKNHPINIGVKSGLDLYHVHSYHCNPIDQTNVLCTTSYGFDVVTGVAKDNIVGLQFHPEKSQPAGLLLLKNFIDWSDSC